MQDIQQKTRWIAAAQVLAGAVMISFSGVYVRLVHVGPTAAAFYRVLFGGLVLLGLSLARRRRLWKNRRVFLLQLACGAAFALDLYAWHRSIHYVGPGLATILGNFQVFFIALLGSLLYGERVGGRLVKSIILAMGGLFLIVAPDWQSLGSRYHLGVLLGLATALCYTAYILVLRRLQCAAEPLSPEVDLAFISLLTALVLAAMSPGELSTFIIPDTWSLGWLLVYAICSQVAGWMLISRGISRLPVSLAGLLLLLQPALAFCWDMLFFSRPTTLLSLVGAALALTGIYLGATSKKME